MRKACNDAVKWPPQIKVAVNLSPAQFQGGRLVEIVSKALTESGFPPQRLELEITESILMQRNAENLKMLHQLKSLGIPIFLDDFGTGYSSLSHLRMFPFDSIKMDRSFVKELSTNSDSAAIVAAVASLGHGLDVDAVAEGVKTEDQLTLIRASGGTRAPCPASEFEFRHFAERKQSGKAA